MVPAALHAVIRMLTLYIPAGYLTDAFSGSWLPVRRFLWVLPLLRVRGRLDVVELLAKTRAIRENQCPDVEF